MDKIEEILKVLQDLKKVWYDDTTLGYLCQMYEDYLKEGDKER